MSFGKSYLFSVVFSYLLSLTTNALKDYKKFLPDIEMAVKKAIPGEKYDQVAWVFIQGALPFLVDIVLKKAQRAEYGKSNRELLTECMAEVAEKYP